MPKYKTVQTYDVYSSDKKNFYGRFTSLTEARKKASQMSVRGFGGKYFDTIIIKNPKITNGVTRPAFQLITVTTEMFIRPKYEFKSFGREAILKDDRPTGKYKYYLIGKDGGISMTSDNFSWYFDHDIPKAGVWTRPRRK